MGLAGAQGARREGRALGLPGAGSRDASCLGDRPRRALGACGWRGVFALPGAPGEGGEGGGDGRSEEEGWQLVAG